MKRIFLFFTFAILVIITTSMLFAGGNQEKEPQQEEIRDVVEQPAQTVVVTPAPEVFELNQNTMIEPNLSINTEKAIPIERFFTLFSERKELLHHGIISGNLEEVKQALAEANNFRIDINTPLQLSSGLAIYISPISLAAIRKQFDIVAYLLDQGADYADLLDDYDKYLLVAYKQIREKQHAKNKIVYLIAWHNFYIETKSKLNPPVINNEELISKLSHEIINFDIKNFQENMFQITTFSEKVLNLFIHYNILYEQGNSKNINNIMFDDVFAVIKEYLQSFDETANIDINKLIEEVRTNYEQQDTFVRKKLFLSQPLSWQINIYKHDLKAVAKIYELLQAVSKKILINLGMSDAELISLTNKEAFVYEKMDQIIANITITDPDMYQAAILNTIELLQQLDQGIYYHITGENLQSDRLLKDIMFGITDIGPRYLMNINMQILQKAQIIGSMAIINDSLANIAMFSPDAAMAYKDHLNGYAGMMSEADFSYSDQLFMANGMYGIMGMGSDILLSDANFGAYMYEQCGRQMSSTILQRGEEAYSMGGGDPAGIILNSTIDVASCFLDASIGPWVSIGVSVLRDESAFQGTTNAIASAATRLNPGVNGVLTGICIGGALDNGLKGMAQGNYPSMSEVERQAKINYHGARVNQLTLEIGGVDGNGGINKEIRDTQGRINQRNNKIESLDERLKANNEDTKPLEEEKKTLIEQNKEDQKEIERLNKVKEDKEKEKKENDQKKRDLEQHDPTSTCPIGPEDEEMTPAEKIHAAKLIAATFRSFLKLGHGIPPWLIDIFNGILGIHYIPQRDPGCIDWPEGYIYPENLPPININKPNPGNIDWGQDYVDPDTLPPIKIIEPLNGAMGPLIDPDGNPVELSDIQYFIWDYIINEAIILNEDPKRVQDESIIDNLRKLRKDMKRIREDVYLRENR